MSALAIRLSERYRVHLCFHPLYTSFFFYLLVKGGSIDLGYVRRGLEAMGEACEQERWMWAPVMQVWSSLRRG